MGPHIFVWFVCVCVSLLDSLFQVRRHLSINVNHVLLLQLSHQKAVGIQSFLCTTASRSQSGGRDWCVESNYELHCLHGCDLHMLHWDLDYVFRPWMHVAAGSSMLVRLLCRLNKDWPPTTCCISDSSLTGFSFGVGCSSTDSLQGQWDLTQLPPKVIFVFNIEKMSLATKLILFILAERASWLKPSTAVWRQELNRRTMADTQCVPASIQCGHAACVDVCLVHVGAECFHWSHVAYHATYIHNPPPLKMYGEGGEAGICSYISTPPPPLKRVLLYEPFFGKIKRLPKEVGDVPHTFSVFGFKSLFRKRWGGGFIHWFCKAMDLWCSWSFPGESYEIAATLLRPLPLFSKPRSFVRLQPWQRERLEIALDSLILWPDIERSCGNQSKGIINFLRLKQHSPPYFHTFPVFYRKPPSPPYIYIIHLILSHLIISHPDYCSKWTWPPYVSYILRFSLAMNW